jgi:hypothetical protein
LRQERKFRLRHQPDALEEVTAVDTWFSMPPTPPQLHDLLNDWQADEDSACPFSALLKVLRDREPPDRVFCCLGEVEWLAHSCKQGSPL